MHEQVGGDAGAQHLDDLAHRAHLAAHLLLEPLEDALVLVAADGEAHPVVGARRLHGQAHLLVEGAPPAARLLGDHVLARLIAGEDRLDPEHGAQAVLRVPDAAALVQEVEALHREEHAGPSRHALEDAAERGERHARLDLAHGLHHDEAGRHADALGVDHHDGEAVGLHLARDHAHGLVGGREPRGDGDEDRAVVAVAPGGLEGLLDPERRGQRGARHLLGKAAHELLGRDVHARLERGAVGVVDAQRHHAHVVGGDERLGRVGSGVGDDGDALLAHGFPLVT